MNITRKLRAVIYTIDTLAKRGALNSDEHHALKETIIALSHALSIKDFSLVEKAIEKIARILLRV